VGSNESSAAIAEHFQSVPDDPGSETTVHQLAGGVSVQFAPSAAMAHGCDGAPPHGDWYPPGLLAPRGPTAARTIATTRIAATTATELQRASRFAGGEWGGVPAETATESVAPRFG
jgi:hypothetical protein